MGHTPRYHFGPFQLDASHRSLVHRDTGRVQIAPRAFQALCFLLEHHGKLVEKSAVMAAVWPNAVVEENSLSQCISALRRALGEQAGESRFVATVPGRGFQFVAPVEVHDSTATSFASVSNDVPPRADRPAADTEAQECVLRAQSLFTRPNPRNLADAADLFRQAIACDPQFARAYLGLAHTMHLQVVFQCAEPDALTQCERNAQAALAIDAQLAQGHALLGIVSAHRARWHNSRHHFDKALSIDRLDPQIILPYVMNLLVTPGYLRRAREMLRDALGSSPALAGLPASLALVSTQLGLDAEAHRYADLALTLGWPRSGAPLVNAISQLAVRAGRVDEASAVIIQGLPAALAASNAADAIRLAFTAFRDTHLRESAVAALRVMERSAPPRDLNRSTRHRLILWYTQLGALDAAFESAHRSVDHFAESGTIGTVWDALWMPEMASFRSDARFAAFSERLGLPAYWAAHGEPDRDEPAAG